MGLFSLRGRRNTGFFVVTVRASKENKLKTSFCKLFTQLSTRLQSGVTENYFWKWVTPSVNILCSFSGLFPLCGKAGGQEDIFCIIIEGKICIETAQTSTLQSICSTSAASNTTERFCK